MRCNYYFRAAEEEEEGRGREGGREGTQKHLIICYHAQYKSRPIKSHELKPELVNSI